MTLSVWSLVAIMVMSTLVICLVVGLLPTRENWPAVLLSVGAGMSIPPAITALAFWLLGSISGPHLSEIWLLLGWVMSLIIAALFALGYDKWPSRSKPPTER
jgi:hypothetical protein